MTNRELAAPFRTLGTVMEYLGENPFKTRSYARAYDTIRKAGQPLVGVTRPELLDIPGIGSAIADKIVEYREQGRIATLDRYLAEVPTGVVELLGVRGLGPKKVRQLVEELAVESVGELLHAIRENRVAALRGFSAKSQDKLREQLEFHQHSLGRSRLADVLTAATELRERLRAAFGRAAFTGQIARQSPIVDRVELIVAGPIDGEVLGEDWSSSDTDPDAYLGTVEGLPAIVRSCEARCFATELVLGTLGSEFAARHAVLQALDRSTPYPDDRAVFAAANLPYVPPPQREAASPWPPVPADEVITLDDIRGVVHAHTTWSDGSASIREMAEAARASGYEYLTITDHSRAAGYAGGLHPDRLREQIEAVRAVDAELEEITLFTGTECDILRDGSLDYDDDLLAELDFVVASVHSVLRMDREDATARLLRAIVNPHVDVLGHPSGRLLLSRPGYPLDYDRIFDACAERGVAIELNASPYRLDLDWTLIPAAVERGVLVSINPDAHSVAGIADIRYGVLAAQKAGLRPAECLNARSATDFSARLHARRS